MTQLQPSLPRKVLIKLSELGVHPDCVASGSFEGACPQCADLIWVAMDFFYGDLTQQGKLLAIVDDFMADMAADRG